MLRFYSSAARPVLLSDAVDDTDTVLTVPSTDGYPDTPFILGIERGTANEEVMLCTEKTGSTFTVERGYDGTTAVAHDTGAIIEHCSAGIDFREAGIVSTDETVRDSLTGDDRWEGRTIWNQTAKQHEYFDPIDGWSALLPAGVIFPYAGAVLPKGFLWCDGSAVSKTTYARLYAALGGGSTPWGESGNDFNLPDLRGKFILGLGTVSPYDAIGATGGQFDHTHTNPATDPAGSHFHTQSATGSGGAHTHTNPNTSAVDLTHVHSVPTTSVAGAHTHTNPNTNSGGSHSHSASSSTGASSESLGGGGSPLPLYGHSHSIGSGGSHSHSQGNTGSGGAHSHTMGDSGSALGSHAHTVGNTASGGAHTHSNPNTSTTGGHSHTQDATGASDPPYAVLGFIIRF